MVRLIKNSSLAQASDVQHTTKYKAIGYSVFEFDHSFGGNPNLPPEKGFVFLYKYPKLDLFSHESTDPPARNISVKIKVARHVRTGSRASLGSRH